MADLPSVCFYCADQNTHRDRSRGITRYTEGLLTHLRATNTLRLSAMVSESSFTIPEGIERRPLPFRTDHFIGRIAGDHFHPLFASTGDAELWHYPKGFLPFGVQVKSKKVGTVADVMLQYDADHHPESRSALAFAYWVGLLKHSIKHFDLILTISEFSKRSIMQFSERHRLKCPPIVVTYLGVEISGPAETVATKEDYVVHLASKYPYKGTTWLLEQWSSLSKEKRDLPILKLVGNLDARGKELFSQMKNVTLNAPLPRADLEDLVLHARAVLMPSEIEGFGIPAVEAYLLGTPTAYARKTALEEVVGPDSPGGFDRDRDSFEAALREVLSMDEMTVKKKKDEMKLRYQWQNCVLRTLEAYRSVL